MTPEKLRHQKKWAKTEQLTKFFLKQLGMIVAVKKKHKSMIIEFEGEI